MYFRLQYRLLTSEAHNNNMVTVASSDRGQAVKLATDSKGRDILLKSGVRVTMDRTRDEGFETETNDCFVHAIKAATGVPYRDAHAFVAARFNRAPRKLLSSLGITSSEAKVRRNELESR